jgi:group II intron reverse transcriptase/maturase
LIKPTTEILERIRTSSTDHKDGVFTRLYRYLLREDIYYIAYQNLYANKGASTKGIDNDTADGFSERYVQTLIAELKDGSYRTKPVRRHYIQKENGKMRPLGIPSFRDKLLQEVIRLFLEAIYEPIFSNNSHGFRPQRSCHTCLTQAKHDFTGVEWFIEGDIKGCFDNIDHEVLLEILQRKIKDSKFINIIRQFLKAGYVEDWKYNSTHSGTPQGGILSPILANIYLNELDTFVANIKKEFDKPRSAPVTESYREKEKEIKHLSSQLRKENGASQRKMLLADLKKSKQELRKTQCTPRDNKRLVYVRYADDWLIGICGNKRDCEEIKEQIREYLRDVLKLELSEEKTLITHSSEKIRFLGYDIRVRRSHIVKGTKNGRKRRTLNYQVELLVPYDKKKKKFLSTKGIVTQTVDGKFKPVHRPHLLSLSDKEIVERYNAEIRGICNFYRLSVNYHKLGYFCYLMEYSCLKTIACKHKSTISKVIDKFRLAKRWAIPYLTKSGVKYLHIVKPADCKHGAMHDTIPYNIHFPRKRTIQERLNARTCELCDDKNAETYEIHHVGSLKKLGDSIWEMIMKKKRRKTLVVCNKCHSHVIHG